MSFRASRSAVWPILNFCQQITSLPEICQSDDSFSSLFFTPHVGVLSWLRFTQSTYVFPFSSRRFLPWNEELFPQETRSRKSQKDGQIVGISWNAYIVILQYWAPFLISDKNFLWLRKMIIGSFTLLLGDFLLHYGGKKKGPRGKGVVSSCEDCLKRLRKSRKMYESWEFVRKYLMVVISFELFTNEAIRGWRDRV